MIRVGRRIYNKDGTYTDPHYPGFTPIICLTKTSPYGDLGPYVLKNNHGHIMENIWQFAKCYEKIPAAKEYYSRYDKTVIWNHPSEVHILNDELTPEWLNWHNKGLTCQYHVRFPAGFNNMHLCKFAVIEVYGDDCDYDIKCGDHKYKKLDYIQARKQIYLPVYVNLVKQQRKFDSLQKRLLRGENLLIIEVDGPHYESLNYYKNLYNVDDDFIVNSTILVNQQNMDIMMNDSKHPFGHGYCLGMALCGLV